MDSVMVIIKAAAQSFSEPAYALFYLQNFFEQKEFISVWMHVARAQLLIFTWICSMHTTTINALYYDTQAHFLHSSYSYNKHKLMPAEQCTQLNAWNTLQIQNNWSLKFTITGHNEWVSASICAFEQIKYGDWGWMGKYDADESKYCQI